jgi:hypothetical protein
MLPGPTSIIACPHCDELGCYETLASGNTFGARLWSDGRMIAPMWHQPPAVVKCSHCGECYWLKQAKKVGKRRPRIGFWSEPGGSARPEWDRAPHVKEPDVRAYHRALEKGLARNPREERTLRMLAWWRRNDASRQTPPEMPSASRKVSTAWRRNLERLATLLTAKDDKTRLMRAEALRELGEFEKAVKVLATVNSVELGGVVRQLRLLCERGDEVVRELTSEH